jgi:hypothetical protein
VEMSLESGDRLGADLQRCLARVVNPTSQLVSDVRFRASVEEESVAAVDRVPGADEEVPAIGLEQTNRPSSLRCGFCLVLPPLDDSITRGFVGKTIS